MVYRNTKEIQDEKRILGLFYEDGTEKQSWN